MLRKNKGKSVRIEVEEVTGQPSQRGISAPDSQVAGDGEAAETMVSHGREQDARRDSRQDEPSQEMRGVPAGSDGEAPAKAGGATTQDAVTEWVAAAPDFRAPETAFVTERLGGKASVDGAGNLMVPVAVGDWTMLLVYDSRFPRPAEGGSPCAKIYFVNPLPEQVAAATGIGIDTFSREGDGNNRYLAIDGFGEFYQAYSAGRSDMLMAERLVHDAAALQQAYGEVMSQGGVTLGRPTITGSRYMDTRSTTEGARPHPACRKVVLSNRAFVQIYNETQARMRTETGGLLLGHYEDGIWYVVEASDPGWDAVFLTSYHEANEHYENHVCEIISRTYRHPLAFLGMWHRHPGSLDTFSGTDDDTNEQYVDACGNGCISGLINYDPDFRITFYYVQKDAEGHATYFQVDVEVGDDRFANKEVLQLAGVPVKAVGVLAQPDPTRVPRRVGGPSTGAVSPLPVSIRGDGRDGRPRRQSRKPKAPKPRRRDDGRGGGFFPSFFQ